MKRISILGSGGMGTALAILLSNSVESIALWSRDPECAAVIETSRLNEFHLSGVRIPDLVRATASIDDAVRDADLIVVAIPSLYLRATLGSIADHIPIGTPALSVVKGIENETFARPSEIIAQVLGMRSIAVLSGPSHAEEIARRLPASVVIAGPDAGLNVAIRDLLNRNSFRVYINQDSIGVELAGALKNILGIATGICDGLRLGDNAKAALLTRGLVEIARFAVDLGASANTFAGLAGVGDVVTTCYSPFGRNRALGERIGEGYTLDQAIASSSGVAEGVPTTRSVHALAQARGIEMPITAEVHAVLFEGKTASSAVLELMGRLPKIEWP